MSLMEPPASGVKVRMYDLQGEGDCFLLAFPGDDGSGRYMLIDCGIFLGTSGGAARLRDVAEDIAGATDHHLHVLVATHEHWDHLIGFEYAKATFESADLPIDEVWLAWTENIDGDQLASDLHQKYEAAAVALAAASERLHALGDPWAESIRSLLAEHRDFGRALGVSTNELMDKVHIELSGHAARYCSPDYPPITLEGVPGVRFFVLGPPRDESQLEVLEEETALHGGPLALDEATAFHSAVLNAFGGGELSPRERKMYARVDERCRPFGKTVRIPRSAAEDYKVCYEEDGKLRDEFFFRDHYGFTEDDPKLGWRMIDNDWLMSAGRLALQMDDYTNNTSLVLAIELTDSGRVLLFPGDAQAGNWRSWEETAWTLEDDDGEEEHEVTGMDLIRRTAFYKVGHHGSHNGTLIEYLRQMRDDLVTMIPVNEQWARGSKGWDHPAGDLLGEIEGKARNRILRADTRLDYGKHASLSEAEWQRFLDGVEEDSSQKQLWIQYTVT